MNKIHFSQQRPLDYIPIRAGLNPGKIELEDHTCPECSTRKNKAGCQTCHGVGAVTLAPKTFTTRTKPLKGEYVIIGGSRFKPFIIEPRIEFKVGKVWKLNLGTAKICEYEPFLGLSDGGLWWDIETLNHTEPLQKKYTFAEMDLGIKGITFDEYRKVLLKLNKNVTLDTIFYINQLIPRVQKE